MTQQRSPLISVPATGETIYRVDLRKLINAATKTRLEIDDLLFLETLIERGALLPDDLGRFISEAEEANLSFADYALRKQLYGDEEIVQLLADQYNWSSVDLTQVAIDTTVTIKIDASRARTLEVLPFQRDKSGVIVVAVANPGNSAALDYIRDLHKGEEVKFVVAAAKQIDQSITKYIEQAIGDEDEGTEVLDFRATGVDDKIVSLFKDLIDRAQEDGVSDIHWEPQEDSFLVRYRIDGELDTSRILAKKQQPQLLALIKLYAGMKPDVRDRPQDGGFKHKSRSAQLEIDIRVVTLPTIWGEKAVMRLVNPNTARLPLDKLGMIELNLNRFNRG